MYSFLNIKKIGLHESQNIFIHICTLSGHHTGTLPSGSPSVLVLRLTLGIMVSSEQFNRWNQNQSQNVVNK